MFNTIPLSESLPESIVNIEEKKRSNLFSWRGQFSPQLIESLILSYGSSEDVMYDPFLGSGTILNEAIRLGMSASGCEINPAALAFAKVYELVNVAPEQVSASVDEITRLLEPYLQESCELSDLHEDLLRKRDKNQSAVTEILLVSLITALDFEAKKQTIQRTQNVWSSLQNNLDSFKPSGKTIRAFSADARLSPLPEESVDLVITSPPYINVFNYHQNYRKSVESMGIDVLKVAKSEIGANRKFRQNRFLTVVQYCMDIGMVFMDLKRVCKKTGKVIFVVGRESNVRHTAFENAELIRQVATICGFKLEGEQHRVFKNMFGVDIYEEILRFSVTGQASEEIIEKAREVGRSSLAHALHTASENVLDEIRDALAKSKKIDVSPLLNNE